MHNRIRGGLIGLLVADAVGASYEFMSPSSLPPLAQLEMVPPRGFRKTWDHVPIGTWTDDGSQALTLLESLLERETFSPGDFAARLLRWAEGHRWVDGIVFDMGGATSRAIDQLKAGVEPLNAGGTDRGSNGNGSLMRLLPLALWHRGSDEELVAFARAQSRVTHGHLRCQLSCAIYCLWARELLGGAKDGWETAVGKVRRMVAGESDALLELDEQILPALPPEQLGRGYVVSSLQATRKALEAGSYEAVVKAAIAFGHDTDTTACIAGGLAGVRDGVDAIPGRWLEELRGRELCDPLLERLVAGRG